MTGLRATKGRQPLSFEDLVLKGDAFGLVFLEPGVRRIGIREDLEVIGVLRPPYSYPRK
jgi:hypothetical protein